MTRTTARIGRLAGALIAGTLVLAGCADDPTADHDSRTTSDGDASASSEAGSNDADVSFVRGMLPHHRSAIEMSRLAEGRAADPRILDLAGRIEAAQAPEIDTLTGWLEEWVTGETGGPDDGGMDHGTGGMMSEQDMQALMRTSGAEFDRLFLAQMIAHHRGAVDMAVTESADGRNADALAMAETIRDSQSAEIAEMEQLLTELDG
jgi:uncharacterized protein (DUF305 family)